MNSLTAFKKVAIVIAVLGGLTLAFQYQNCAPSTGGDKSFKIDSSSGSPSTFTITTPVVASPLQVSQNFQVSINVSGDGASGASCAWNILSGTTPLFASPQVSSVTSGVCTFSGTTPATPGTYVMTVTAINSKNVSASSSASFVTQSTPPTLNIVVDTLSVTPSPPTATQSAAIQASGTSNLAQNLTIVIGELISGVGYPFAGCAATVNNTTAISTNCNYTFATPGTHNIYVEISSGSTVRSCTSTAAGTCGGTYSLNVQAYQVPTPTPTVAPTATPVPTPVPVPCSGSYSLIFSGSPGTMIMSTNSGGGITQLSIIVPSYGTNGVPYSWCLLSASNPSCTNPITKSTSGASTYSQPVCTMNGTTGNIYFAQKVNGNVLNIFSGTITNDNGTITMSGTYSSVCNGNCYGAYVSSWSATQQ